MTVLAVDVGSAFVDLAVAEGGPDAEDAAVRLCKEPVGADAVAAMLAGLARLGVPPAALSEVRIATTQPLNALLRRQDQPVALLTTAGFGDTLQLGRQNRLDLYDPVARSPAPVFLVPEGGIHELRGRHDPTGAETEPLSQADLDTAIAAMRAAEVSAVAICLLFAHVEPAHEMQAAQAIRAALPGVAISLSHQVDPAPREYERTVSTLLDAWLKAAAGRGLAGLGTALRQAGFTGTLMFCDGRGTLIPEELGLSGPARLLAGGPAAAARGGAGLVTGNALTLDMGSVSTDLSLARDGRLAMIDDGVFAGVPLRQHRADVASLALGGQARTVAGPTGPAFAVDAAGPTLDAALVAAGRAEGDACGLDHDTAMGIVAAAEQALAEALIRFAARRNVDPSRASLVAMGGAGPLLAAGAARAAGLRRVVLAHAPAVAGALGLLASRRQVEVSARLDVDLPDLDADRLGAVITDLTSQVETLADGGGGPIRLAARVAARAQMHPLSLALDAPPRDGAALFAALDAAYRDSYGIAPPGPGHAFALTAWCAADGAALPAGMADEGSVGARVDGGATGCRVDTAAGAIWVAPNWRLTRTAHGYSLSDEAPQ